jgi:hypothetical protein
MMEVVFKQRDMMAACWCHGLQSTCFGCGPAHQDGLHLQSRRVPGGWVGVQGLG